MGVAYKIFFCYREKCHFRQRIDQDKNGKTGLIENHLNLRTEASILQTVGYFDIFQYPLTAEEIHRFLGCPVTEKKVTEILKLLCVENRLFCIKGFYSLTNNPALVRRREDGNKRALHLLEIAYRIGNLLYKFPFVKGVGISGSLSKNYADEGADIDFFIITSSNRLWIARTLLHFLKKISFLVGKEHWYCMNYFIDEDALEIAEKNLFTATEVVTLKPVCGEEVLKDFFSANEWVSGFLPNTKSNPLNEMGFMNEPWYKNIVEKLFNNRFGVWLDEYLMRVTKKRWVQKETNHQVNMKGEPVGLKIGKHVARPNPEHLQKKILDMLAEKKAIMKMEWDIKFD